MLPHTKTVDDYVDRLMKNSIYLSCMIAQSPDIKLADDAPEQLKKLYSDEYRETANIKRRDLRTKSLKQLNENYSVM
jgi:hypothetical protein